MIVPIVKGILTGLTLFAQGVIVIIILSLLIKRKPFIQIRKFFAQRNNLYAAIVATTAFLGSMFFSEIAGYTPCRLCWYQRIFIFPQFIILWIAYFRKEIQRIKWYMLPLLVISLLISGYHWLIQLIPSKSTEPCGLEASCVARYIYELNHITIAGMAFTACLLVLLLIFMNSHKKKRITK